MDLQNPGLGQFVLSFEVGYLGLIQPIEAARERARSTPQLCRRQAALNRCGRNKPRRRSLMHPKIIFRCSFENFLFTRLHPSIVQNVVTSLRFALLLFS